HRVALVERRDSKRGTRERTVSLTVDFVGLSEAAAVDSRGVLTLVGFHPQAFMIDRFPAQLAPAFVVVIQDDGEPTPTFVAGQFVKVQLKVAGPDGEVIFLVEQQQQVGPTPWSTLPARLQMVA